jgi:probable blue pigment (indigoidine) exporter
MHYCGYFTYHCYNDDERSVFWWEPPDDSLQMLVGSVLLAVPGFLFEQPTVVLSSNLIIAFSYTVFMPGLLATFIWFWLVGRIGAVKAATFHFLNPFFGVAIAAIFLGESLRFSDIVGVIVIMAGILSVQLARQTSD